MRRLYLLILLFVVIPIVLQAQDITGIWQGHFRSSNASQLRSSIFDDRYKFEVQVAQHNKTFEAITYSYLSSFFYGKAEAKGTVNPKTSKVLLQEGKLIEFRNSFGDICIMTCFLQYTKSGGDEFLEGTYTSMNIRDSSNCGHGIVFLHKVPISDFYTEPFVAKREKEIAKADSLKTAAKVAVRKPITRPGTKPGVTAAPLHKPAGDSSTTPAKSLAKTTPPGKAPVKKTEQPTRTSRIAKVDVAKEPVRQPGRDSNLTSIGRKFPTIAPRVLVDRQNQLVKTIYVHTNEVTLNIYDDGVIDGDTVSVYLDNKEVINHAMLTDKPLIVTIHLDESNDYHEVVMVAENEGTIPPNTSLMIVKAGDKEYEVRITSTEQKNAVVRFQYTK